jgi:hypothetical protein
VLKNDRHSIVAELKRLASELGRVPSREELRGFGTISEKALKKVFGGYTVALAAAGLRGAVGEQAKPADKPSKFKYKKAQLQGFTVHEIDLPNLFERAGNPESLKVVAQPDTHAPYHDEEAMACFLDFLSWYGPDVHVIMGDFADMAGISHWPPDSFEARRLVPEMIEARKLLAMIKAVTPKATTRIYLEGNHEDWLRQACVAKMPELFDGLNELGIHVDLKSILDLDSYGYELIPMNHIARIGRASFTHGLYTGDNHPRTHLNKLKTSIYYGHVHDIKSTNDCSIDGPMDAQSLGCLCRLDAPFLKGKPNNWVHSFGVFEFFRDGSYCFVLPRIVNGKISFAGRVFRGRD